MKIAFFSLYYFPTINGVITGMENLRRGLTELGHEVYIFAPKSKKYSYSNDVNLISFPSLNIDIKKNGFFLPLPITFSPKVFKKIKRLNLDIIHTQHPFYIGESAHFYAKRFKIPLVFTFWTQYDEYALAYLPFLPKKITTKASLKYINDFVSRCDGVIVPNQEIVKNKYLKKSRVKNTVINFGIDIKKYQGKSKIAKNDLGIKSEQTVLLTLSRIAKEKNIDFLIRSFDLIQQENKKVVFLIVGNGPAKKELERQVQKRNLPEKVIFTGEVPYQKVADYYKLADIFVYSCLTDVQPQSLLEATAAGLPIVAIDSPDREYLVKNGKNGLLTPDNEEIFAKTVLKLIKDFKLRKKLGQRTSKVAKKFSYYKKAQETVNFYRRIIKYYR